VRTPNSALAPSPDPEPVARTRRGRRLAQPPRAPAPGAVVEKRSPTPRTRSHSAAPAELPVPRKAPPASAPRSRSRCSPAALPARLHKLVRLRKGPGRGTRLPGDRTHPAIAVGWGARTCGHAPASRAPSPQPRSVRSRVAPGARKPPGPRRVTHAPGPAPPPSSLWLRSSGLSRGGGACGRLAGRLAWGGQRARGGRRAPGLHMLTRAAGGQRPAASGS
jgi:hypothetical protein